MSPFLPLEVAVLCLIGSFSTARPVSAEVERPPTRVEIQSLLREEASAVGLNPDFVVAICFAESSFNPAADSGYARGLMQVSHIAWRQVRRDSWDYAYDWRENIRAGVDYLVWCRAYLNDRGQFSYANLAAAYRFGPVALQRAGFEVGRLRTCPNVTYRLLLAGQTKIEI